MGRTAVSMSNLTLAWSKIICYINVRSGEVAEWLKAALSKSVRG